VASGDTLLLLNTLNANPSVSESALRADGGERNGQPSFRFEDQTAEFVEWTLVMPQNYTNTTGITVLLFWAATNTSADGNDVRWSLAIRSMATSEDIDVSHTFVYTHVADTEGTGSGRLSIASATMAKEEVVV